MPWPGPRRTHVAAKLADDTITRLDQRAEAEGLMLPRGDPNRSEMIRLAIDYSLTHMPPGWRPEQETTVTVTTSTPTGVYGIHTAKLEEGAYAYINDGGYTDEQQTAIVEQLMAELRTAVDAAPPEGWSWLPGADEILRPADSEYDDVAVAEVFTEAADSVYSRYEEIEAVALA